ncbi:bifunctional diaminohydroxyphosphoribosylaminopyrimidine deaminase/5-amino-6-(5-phosphoribosylamino)uracil reductase RibD [Aliiglaciecola sp. 3_MG-2023]|uniref:bifunctional diaminohydroxyphosphoribosylaminopyrimidine deaminase/5-amino-6-(5-phosphoribosylamino)uracil reductase RibD n=1 Tax=Aliiglaciecola sp. 3_MG-2023 TaxID=3062644 RepID=UPI0026E36908|nr:bifunctional diaminohydroxyphosphoribosylaminopyrimidine deaminase/5-amino-6-(5-phosphoribosylamino)uracil reductase RibD [Aliiglaciecola sp. 3_MG-2023]MDO6693966.1 bifunctional diaminohydroxyphosphoribosylaminopyrimidine deaminase/5-amino-6-(5-phosphoribosylamino)uracil reductase RibD [Aliiglaciecola sp. 3_MG-2023]
MSAFHFSTLDHHLMSLAIKLARKGQFTTTPNPNVGCVIANTNGGVIGQGWHHKAGTPHAEVHALKQAGEQALGATAYVTLEPCSHFGRTPPCADALIQAGVKRVVAAMVDPNPTVAGSGLKRLSEHGIDVSFGLLSEQAQELNRGFIKRMQNNRPWVSVKLAASLDGKTALANGLSQWITGPDARADVQAHRARSCGILSGSGTVLADNPSLNVRYNELNSAKNLIQESELRQPLRIILDGKNQLNDNLKMFDLPGQNLIINRKPNPLLRASVEQVQIASVGNKLDLAAMLRVLADKQLNEVWVEAGGMLAGALVQQNLVDELILYQAPKLLGDKGQNLFVMDELTQMNQAKRLKWSSVRMVGDDLKMVAHFNQTTE